MGYFRDRHKNEPKVVVVIVIQFEVALDIEINLSPFRSIWH